jgi:hypothetical protein
MRERLLNAAGVFVLLLVGVPIVLAMTLAGVEWGDNG